MINILYKNELIKRKFFEYLENSKGFKNTTIACYDRAILLWEDFTSKEDFANFNKTKAEGFKTWLRNKKKFGSSENIGISHVYDNLRHLKRFFEWLSKQSGYRKINQTDVDYLNLLKGEVRIATQSKTKSAPSLEEVKTVLESIKCNTEIDMRDRALISLTLLIVPRITAIISLPIGSFNKNTLTVDQDPKLGVKTKFSKRISSVLAPFLYKESLNYFLDWVEYLKVQKKFSAKDPIFPATKIENAKGNNVGYFNTETVEPVFWKSSSSAREIFKKRFKQAGFPYHHPHSFRDLFVKEVSKLSLTEEQKKAISQNLGHENVAITFGSYGHGRITDDRQREIIQEIDFEKKNAGNNYLLVGRDDLKNLLNELKNQN